jgi:CubicO group peptidase (beta-lactamase class C family)
VARYSSSDGGLWVKAREYLCHTSVVLIALGCGAPPAAPSTCVAAGGTPFVPSSASEADAALAELVASRRTAAVGAAVTVGLGPRWWTAHGLADPGGDGRAPVEATVDTPFLLASVTKTFVATAVMQLVEDGAVDLDADVGAQAPALAAVRNPAFPEAPVTPRMLLTHTAGVWDAPFTFDATWATSGDSPVPMTEFVAGYFADEGPYSGGADAWWAEAPGAFFCYSNMGFGVLGALVEEVGGRSLEDLLRERVLDPLGLSHTSFRADHFCDGALVRGVRDGRNGWVDHDLGAGPQPEGHPELASGMLKSSPRDLAAFAAAIANGGVGANGARILDAATVEGMLTRQLDPGITTCGDGRSDPSEQALGFTHFPAGDRDWVGHYGGMNGASSAMWASPASAGRPSLAYAVVTNVGDPTGMLEGERAVFGALDAVSGATSGEPGAERRHRRAPGGR